MKTSKNNRRHKASMTEQSECRAQLRPHRNKTALLSEASRTEGRAPLLAGGTAKGQASLMDLVMGFFIFMLVFASVTALINKNDKDLLRNTEIEEIRHDCFFAAKELTETKGFPNNWETLDETEIQRIGLIEKHNTISENKLVAFSNLSYDKAKELLKLKGYDFYFVLDGEDYVTAGLAPISQTKYLMNTKRIINYKGSEAEIELQVYELWE